ncbi:MAG: HNH endonuclease family protein, partial [Acidimicrobiales bacterium]
PDPDELEIDHVVPLAEAWDSGVGGWDQARRREFANDPLELLAVSRATNRSKSDDDPAEWQPPNRAAWCQYAGLWTLVTLKYGLTADPAEVQALTNMAAGCP